MTVAWQRNLTTATVTLEKYNDHFNKNAKIREILSREISAAQSSAKLNPRETFGKKA